jgi:CcmD family protein
MKQKLFLFICCFCTTLLAFAQDSTVEMADTMRREGKIYVVVAVILAIFAGIIFYLIRLDRKISRLEKEGQLNSIINNKR